MKIKLLRQAVESIKSLKHPGHLLEGEEFQKWLDSAGLIHSSISMSTGTATGFDANGIAKVIELAKMLRKETPDYGRGIFLPAFIKQVADMLISKYGNLENVVIESVHVEFFETEVERWFKQSAVKHRHFIPCSIWYGPAESFSVGPATFIHFENFSGHTLDVAQDNVFDNLLMAPLFDAMKERSASWIAVVDVDGCHLSRSSELADLAVDIAIGILQLAIPREFSERMARITARTLPPWRSNVVMAGNQLSGGVQNLQPNFSLPGALLDLKIAEAQPLIGVAGQCLSAFLSGSGPLSKLRLAWCDAAYWFHEGMAEPLDSLSVAKLETAVEVLLRSESTSGSQKRMEQAIHALTGLSATDPISPGALLSVKQFVKSFVEARSRVLHGTLSTLMSELTPERVQLASLVREILVHFAISLAAYANTGNLDDNIEKLLEWIARTRKEWLAICEATAKSE